MHPLALPYAALDLQYRYAVMCGAWWLHAWTPESTQPKTPELAVLEGGREERECANPQE